MKNYLFVVLLGLIMFSCKSEDEKVLSKVDSYFKKELVKNLKYPQSFEKVSSVITRRTISNEFDTENLKYYKKLNDQIKVDSIQNKINNTPDNFVCCYFITYTYRAKNGFGGLDVYERDFRFDPYLNGIDVMKYDHQEALNLYFKLVNIDGGILWVL